MQLQGMYFLQGNDIFVDFQENIFIHKKYIHSRKLYSFNELHSFKDLIFIQGIIFIQGKLYSFKE